MNDFLSTYLNTPLQIRDKTIPVRLMLAPMTMLGNVAFRELVAGYGGCGILSMEMVSAKNLPCENEKTSPCFRWRKEEMPQLICQIFGNDPDMMKNAAQRIAGEGLFGVDINFGCSVSAICNKKCGAAVLKDPDHAVKIVTAVRKAIDIPLFVKFRTGWKDDPDYAVRLARRFEDAGADALTFHPRVAPDRRSRPPKWAYIGMVKKAVSIPVFGNGNVFSKDDCFKLIKETGCDGVAIARMAVVKPWFFSMLSLNRTYEDDIYYKCAIMLYDLLLKHFDSNRARNRFKKFINYYAANFLYGHELSRKIKNEDNLEAAISHVHDFFKDTPQIVSRPNLNFLT